MYNDLRAVYDLHKYIFYVPDIFEAIQGRSPDCRGP
jgi:hypothetical protein